MKTKLIIFDFLILGALSLILNLFNIRICPFYHIFKIPCPGCGLTRGFIELIKLNIQKSLEYNILCIPIFLFFIFYLFLLIIKKNYLISNVLNRYKIIIIFICSLILIIVFIININNPLLY